MAKTKTDHWSHALAEKVLAEFPNAKEYVSAAGISPSGVVHFGNFRDVMTAQAVTEILQQRGQSARTLFSWDDFDRFRKVPAGLPPSYEEHIGKPLSAVPAPQGEGSYAEYYERIFEQAMRDLKIELDYRYQTKLYQAGTYDDGIIIALRAREQIADILLSFMSDKAKGAKGIDPKQYRADYFPVAIYSEFSGKDSTNVTDYDGQRTLQYYCAETKQEGVVEIGKHRNIKLGWKIDWAMRWGHENVAFEPSGADHAAPGGSYHVANRIATEVFKIKPPVPQIYGFVGIRGEAGKMSGSTGQAVSPNELLEIYDLDLLKWLYVRRAPKQNFNLAFDSEIFRQYDEFDREQGTGKPIPFRQAVAFGQIVGWNESKLRDVLKASGFDYDNASITSRLPKAKRWLEKYNPAESVALLEQPNAELAKAMPEEQRRQVAELHQALQKDDYSVTDLEDVVYGIPKDPKLDQKGNAPRQREFFKIIYNLLIGQDTGPRLSTFLWAANRQKVLKLLDI